MPLAGKHPESDSSSSPERLYARDHAGDGLAHPVSPFYREASQPNLDDMEEAERVARESGNNGLPNAYTFDDLNFTPTASERRERDGSRLPIVELKCPRCKAGLLVRASQAVGPPGKPIPLCTQCLKQGVRCVLTRSEFGSGPLVLNT